MAIEICIREVPGFNPGRDTGYSDRFSLVPEGKFWDSLGHSHFPTRHFQFIIIILSFNAVWTEILISYFRKLRIQTQECPARAIMHNVLCKRDRGYRWDLPNCPA